MLLTYKTFVVVVGDLILNVGGIQVLLTYNLIDGVV